MKIHVYLSSTKSKYYVFEYHDNKGMKFGMFPLDIEYVKDLIADQIKLKTEHKLSNTEVDYILNWCKSAVIRYEKLNRKRRRIEG